MTSKSSFSARRERKRSLQGEQTHLHRGEWIPDSVGNSGGEFSDLRQFFGLKQMFPALLKFNAGDIDAFNQPLIFLPRAL